MVHREAERKCAARDIRRPSDIPVPGDYDHTGRTQVAVFRPSTGQWFIDDGNLLTNPNPTIIMLGMAGDMPVPGDYSGVGYTTAAVFRPSTGQWIIDNGNLASNPSPTVISFGGTGDIPVPGDYLGAGYTQIAVFRPGNDNWYIDSGMLSGGTSSISIAFGGPGDIPVPGDYLGVGFTQVAVYRPGNSDWYINDGFETAGTATSFFFGGRGDVPIPQANVLGYGLAGLMPLPRVYNTDGKSNAAVGAELPFGDFGPLGSVPVPANYVAGQYSQTAVFTTSSAGSTSNRDMWTGTGLGGTLYLGLPGDIPVPADYDGLGHAQAAVFRPSNETWVVDDSNALNNLNPTVYTNLTYNGQPIFLPGDIPVPGDYLSKGYAQLAVFRPSTDRFVIYDQKNGGAPTIVGLGSTLAAWGVLPVPMDYYSYASAQPAVFDPSYNYQPNAPITPQTWSIIYSLASGGQSTTLGVVTTNPSVAGGDIAVPGDYLATTYTTLAVYRPSTGLWFLSNSSSPVSFGSGSPALPSKGGDVPIPGVDTNNSGSGFLPPYEIYRPVSGQYLPYYSQTHGQAFSVGSIVDSHASAVRTASQVTQAVPTATPRLIVSFLPRNAVPLQERRSDRSFGTTQADVT